MTEEELAKINQYTRRPMKAEDVYTFSLVLCDNEVDRDFECFTAEALQKLAPMFLGKTGIFDHSAKAEHQAARIFETFLEEEPGRLTEDGEVYTKLIAKAYLPKSEKTSQLILEIDSGIKKEVSVGCAMAKRVCSVCGADKRKEGCPHEKGKPYSVYGTEKVAHDILSEPTDAYEWSFVAVPAQRRAGVIKRFETLGDHALDLQKLFSMEDREELILTKEAATQLRRHMETLEEAAKAGRRYREQVKEDVLKWSRFVQPDVSAAVFDRMLAAATLDDLESLRKSYRKQAERKLPIKPQLWRDPRERETRENREFKI